MSRVTETTAIPSGVDMVNSNEMRVIAVFCSQGQIVAALKSTADVDPVVINNDKTQMRDVLSMFRGLTYKHLNHRFAITIYKRDNHVLIERDMYPERETAWVDFERRESEFLKMLGTCYDY